MLWVNATHRTIESTHYAYLATQTSEAIHVLWLLEYQQARSYLPTKNELLFSDEIFTRLKRPLILKGPLLFWQLFPSFFGLNSISFQTKHDVTFFHFCAGQKCVRRFNFQNFHGLIPRTPYGLDPSQTSVLLPCTYTGPRLHLMLGPPHIKISHKHRLLICPKYTNRSPAERMFRLFLLPRVTTANSFFTFIDDL